MRVPRKLDKSCRLAPGGVEGKRAVTFIALEFAGVASGTPPRIFRSPGDARDGACYPH